MIDDHVLRGTLRSYRNGQFRRERMNIETAVWILRNDCAITVDDALPDFTSDNGTELWWHHRTKKFSHYKEPDRG